MINLLHNTHNRYPIDPVDARYGVASVYRRFVVAVPYAILYCIVKTGLDNYLK